MISCVFIYIIAIAPFSTNDLVKPHAPHVRQALAEAEVQARQHRALLAEA